MKQSKHGKLQIMKKFLQSMFDCINHHQSCNKEICWENNEKKALSFALQFLSNHRCTGQGGSCPPPSSLVRDIISRAILLKNRAILLFMFCFTNILNIFFSFVTCSMHKNPHQNAGNGIKETLFFQIFLASMALNPLRGSHAFGASRANSYQPPQNF